MNCTENILKRLRESKSYDNSDAEYLCKSIIVHSNGVMEILCYDTVEDEDFEKYIGYVEDPSARKNARLILKDPKFEVPKNVRNELISTFGLEDFGFSIEEATSAGDAWGYWEMSKDYKGPWVHPNYSKNYDNSIVGFIYPPYNNSANRFLKDMSHDDYIAELFDDESGDIIETGVFDTLGDAQDWLDELAAR